MTHSGATRAVGDWGTSKLRLFKLVDGIVVARATGPGVGVANAPLQDVLRRALHELDLHDCEVLLCGMAGSRMGLLDTGYCRCPISVADWRASAVPTTIHGDTVTIMPGVTGTNLIGAPDVMRGEEAQVFGAMTLNPELAVGRQVFVLPGTHSKWVETDEGAIVRFHTFPTGELFALLSRSSTMAGDDGVPEGGVGFDNGMDRAFGAPGVLSTLFEARSGQLIDARCGAWATDYLSGVLIASEVHEAVALLPSSTGSPVLIGDPALMQRYAKALARHDLTADAMDGDRCALAGLGVASLELGEA